MVASLGAIVARRSPLTRPSCCMRVQASHIVSWMNTDAPGGAFALRYSSAAFWLVKPQNCRLRPRSAAPAAPPTSGTYAERPNGHACAVSARGAATTQVPSAASAATRRAPAIPAATARRMAAATSSKPRPASSASAGYAGIQCFVPPKIGVAGRKNGPTATAMLSARSRSVSRGSRGALAGAAPGASGRAPSLRAGVRRPRPVAAPVQAHSRRAPTAAACAAPTPKRRIVIVGTVASTMTGRYALGDGGPK